MILLRHAAGLIHSEQGCNTFSQFFLFEGRSTTAFFVFLRCAAGCCPMMYLLSYLEMAQPCLTSFALEPSCQTCSTELFLARQILICRLALLASGFCLQSCSSLGCETGAIVYCSGIDSLHLQVLRPDLPHRSLQSQDFIISSYFSCLASFW